MTPGGTLSWWGIVRLGLAQMMLGAVVVIATATLNRVMVVELALPAILPGLLIGLHYAMQLLRPVLGFAADRGGRQTRWIIGGMAAMAAGVVLAAVAAGLIRNSLPLGLSLATIGYALMGLGVASMGTSLLTLLAVNVAANRRPAAATIVWLMMIAGSAITAGIVGHVLQPFSFGLLLRIVACVGGIAMGVTLLAVWGVERRVAIAAPAAAAGGFRGALASVWADPVARRFAMFVFVSMLAYSGQELILEPFAGLVFSLPPSETARLSGLQHGGVLAGMALVALAGTAIGGRLGSMRVWTVAGCLGSAAALLALALSGAAGPGWPLRPTVFLLGLANGTFAVSAIGAMLQLAGRRMQAGTSMGLWGAAQAVAFACGGLFSSGSSDVARHLLGSPVAAYAIVFAVEAGLFLYAARLATRIFSGSRADAMPLGLAST